MSDTARLFTPLTIRGVTLPNRIVLSPLCMYSANDGIAQPFHFAHLSAFARGRAGTVMAEATAVEARGRITPKCLGIWSDAHAEALKPITQFISDVGSVPGIQLAHAGRKAGTKVPWMGGTPLDDEDAARGEGAWDTVGPSAIKVADGWRMPKAMDADDLATVKQAFVDGAKRAIAAGFRLIELHAAHGYLLHSFLSPLSNHRNDEYGGDIHGRMKFPLEVVDAVRAAIPDDIPLFLRISAVDGPADGWTLDDSVELSRKLTEHGVDVVDCSGGGISGAPLFRVNNDNKPMKTNMDRGPGFQVPFAERIRNETDMKTMAVGVIVDPHQAEEILAEGRADLVAMGRELMYNPFWPLHAAQALKSDDGFDMWPDQYRWAVNRRATLAEFKGIRDGAAD